MRKNIAKQKMISGSCIFGAFANGLSPEMIEIMGLAGFDFITIDSEHASSSVELNRTLITAGESRGVTMFTRVTNKDQSTVLRNLDVGAQGILVPQVNSREEAESIVRSSKYFPEGMRGVATPRAADYGMNSSITEYMANANQNLLIAVQCESTACVKHLDEIASVPGIDVIFIGPFDLSQSLGVPGKVFGEEVGEVIEKVLACTKTHGKYAGIYTGSVEMAKKYRDMGFRYIIVGTDIKYFSSACKQAVRDLNS
ncbi:HpcH/HpaI aldolase family protein [Caproicibacter sp.]|uniref:HpcH/HpaI aldolase family protein n=1 Tax=Caproicibacter sp. TaxID=2814884 RepID=UPI003989463C